MIDSDDLRAAYDATTIGDRAPGCMVCSGATILHHHPDLAYAIDPNAVYRVSISGSTFTLIEPVEPTQEPPS